MSLDIILEALAQLENQTLQDIDEKVITKREGRALISLVVGLRDRLEEAGRAKTC
jgi:chromosome condensin MukBEF complex kleisin-like MukF subunit